MINIKKLCKDHNLNSYQAQKAAELTKKAALAELSDIINTPSPKTLRERLAECFELDLQTFNQEVGEHVHEKMRMQHKYQLP